LISYLKRLAQIQSLRKFAEAEEKLEEARATALTFFTKKKPKDQDLNYKFREIGIELDRTNA
jgi:hypothetical protein